MFKPTTEIKPEFLGITGCNSFAPNVSSPRLVMFFNHFSQRPSLLNPDSKLVKSGIEFELAKYINDVKSEEDCVVKAIIPRYFNAGFSVMSSLIVIVEYEKVINGQAKLVIDYIEVPYSMSQHGTFGANLKPTEYLQNLQINQEIPRNTILATTDSYKSDNSYGYGLNANVAFMSIPEVSEDSFAVSRSFAKRAEMRVIETRTIFIDKDTIPLNLFGDDERYKFLPDIGEMVKPNGLLCATRPRNDWFSVCDLSNSSLREHDSTFDTGTYVKTHSRVVDIKVIKTNHRKNEFTDKVTEQLDYYANLLVNFYQTVVMQVNTLIDSKKQMYKTVEHVELSPRLHRLMTDMIIQLESTQPNSKTKLTYKKLPINQYKIDITTETTLVPDNGFKLTCISAGKGVISKIIEDEDMPVDAYGNRADVITDPSSTISRMNLGRVYEAYLGAVARDNRNRLVARFVNQYNQRSIQKILPIMLDEDIEYTVNYLKGLYTLINPQMLEFISSLNKEELVWHVHEILLDKLVIFYPTNNEYNIVDVIDNIEKSMYAPYYSQVTYRDSLGNIVTTKEKIRIGNFYVMVLEKTADDYMAVSSAKVNNFSFPVKSSGIDKHRQQHSHNPTKALSVTEFRIVRACAGVEATAEFADINTNPNTHKQITKNILNTANPISNLPDMDREANPEGQNKPLLIFKHMANAYGIDFKYVPEEDTLDE